MSEDLEAICRVLASGRTICGPEVEAFEKELASEWGGPGWEAVAVSSGTDALRGAIWALNASRIGMPTFTFRACAEAVPVNGWIDFYGCGEDFIVPNRMRSEVHAEIRVDLFGKPAWRGRNLTIQDASQAFGAPLYGDLVTTSFYPSKNLAGVGEGGAILTKNPAWARRLRVWRNHGWDGKEFVTDQGGNYKMDEINAAVLRGRLKHWKRDLDARTEVAWYYSKNALGKLPVWDTNHTWNNYVVTAEFDWDTPPGFRRYYEECLHWSFDGNQVDCTKDSLLTRRVVALPTKISLEEAKRKCEEFNARYEEARHSAG